jgi:hypothetical protein
MSSQLSPSSSSQRATEKVELSVVPSAPAPSPTQLALCRRFDTVLDDFGFASISRQTWATPNGDSIGLADLTLESVECLIRQLEDLTSSANQPCHRAGSKELENPQQLRLF